MEVMTKEQARLFKERWRAVNEITIEEARRKTVSERLRDLEDLYELARHSDGPIVIIALKSALAGAN